MPDNPFTLLALSGRDASRETIGQLADSGKVLDYSLVYTPPYEAFAGIRELQLAVRRMGPFPPETLVIDLTEWVGHEEEEYFEVTAMFLHDHRSLWNYAFLAREHSMEDCAMLYFTLRSFLEGRMIEDRTFADRDSLSFYLTVHHPINKDAADTLAGILLSPQARMLRSYPRVDALLSELSRGGRITELRITEAMNDPASILHLFKGRDFPSITPERRSLYAREVV